MSCRMPTVRRANAASTSNCSTRTNSRSTPRANTSAGPPAARARVSPAGRRSDGFHLPADSDRNPRAVRVERGGRNPGRVVHRQKSRPHAGHPARRHDYVAAAWPGPGRPAHRRRLRDELETKFKKYYKVPSIIVTPIKMNTQLDDLRNAIGGRSGLGPQSGRARSRPRGPCNSRRWARCRPRG